MYQLQFVQYKQLTRYEYALMRQLLTGQQQSGYGLIRMNFGLSPNPVKLGSNIIHEVFRIFDDDCTHHARHQSPSQLLPWN